MAGSPERPAVLRRLGIVKDTDDAPFGEDFRSSIKSEEALELFEAEHDSAPRFRIDLKWVPAAGVAALALLRRSAVIGVILVFATSMIAGVWLINRIFGSPRSSTETASNVAPDAGSGVPAEHSPAAPTGKSKTPGDVVLPSARRATAPRVSAIPGSRAQQASASLLQGRSGGVSQSGAADGASLQVPFASLPTSSDLAVAAPDETIYSAENQDVVPPQTAEKLPGPTIGRWTTRTNAMEVIVSESGVVERVRLVTPPARMPDMQLLSVAKVWRFTPAMKDGRPVRYRLLVTWEVNP